MAASPKKGNQNYPGNLYRGMIRPLAPFALRGALWYQGEANAKTPAGAFLYRDLLSAMIRNWRELWNQGDFPVYFVQLPNFQKAQTEPVEDMAWPMIRESFMSVAKTLPNTGMAITIDIGEADDIHPKNKQDVGKRLALMALNKTYGKDIVASGPVYKSMKAQKGKVVIQFDHLGSGLAARGGGDLKTFAVAGKDKVFHWAEARIEGDTVVVSSDEVKSPKSVRYAWAPNPVECNLINKEGLPASPFRTDDWEAAE